METPSLREETPVEENLPPEPCLVHVISGDAPLGPGRHWPLGRVDVVEIGRGAAATSDVEGRMLRVAIVDRHASTTHVRLSRRGAVWAVEDVDSKNGTTLNGEPVVRALLRDGDVVGLGASLFVFDASGGPLPALPTGAAFATVSATAAATYARLATIASSDLPILLLGETGVGKEVVARAIHALAGDGRRGAFVGVNCAALTPTLLEASLFGHRRGAFTGAVDSRPGFVRSADNGTLFLDEVAELSAAAQAALLRVIQEREVVPLGESEPVAVDIRVIAATHRDLAADVEAGRFRRDLYARLAGVVAQLPALRDRRVDLGSVLASLLARHAPADATPQLTARTTRALFDYDWPQNVRELEMAVRAAGALARWGKIDVAHLPSEITRERDGSDRDELVALIRTHQGNLAAVARALKTSRTQIHRMLKRHAITPDSYR